EPNRAAGNDPPAKWGKAHPQRQAGDDRDTQLGQPVDHRLTEAPCPSGNFGRFVVRGRLGGLLFVTGFVVGSAVLGAGRKDVLVVGGGGPIAPTAGAAHARSTKEPSHG